MTKLSVIGYPRIGEKRELKRLVEGYLKSERTKKDLVNGSADLKARHWKLQQETGIDFISSNDFGCIINIVK